MGGLYRFRSLHHRTDGDAKPVPFTAPPPSTRGRLKFFLALPLIRVPGEGEARLLLSLTLKGKAYIRQQKNAAEGYSAAFSF